MNDSGFVDHCLELLSPLGSTRSHRMFGGHALYVDDLCVALIIGDVFYLKVDDAHRPTFAAAHGRPFTYAGKSGDVHVLSYYTVPEEAMESPAEMLPWARRALSAAVAARAKAPPKKKAAARKAPARKTAAARPTAAKKAAPAKAAPSAAAKKKAAPVKAPAKKAAARPADARRAKKATPSRARAAKP